MQGRRAQRARPEGRRLPRWAACVLGLQFGSPARPSYPLQHSAAFRLPAQFSSPRGGTAPRHQADCMGAGLLEEAWFSLKSSGHLLTARAASQHTFEMLDHMLFLGKLCPCVKLENRQLRRASRRACGWRPPFLLACAVSLSAAASPRRGCSAVTAVRSAQGPPEQASVETLRPDGFQRNLSVLEETFLVFNDLFV